ncbi:MAG: CRISPR-associated endonuclease Cas1 [Desulfobacterales bacterium]|nr:CRISPR-associated endonuclease Cas1 [Desulfobacterales bacterium]
MFRYAYNSFLYEGEAYHQLGVIITPADTGVLEYNKDDAIEIGIAFPISEEKRIREVLASLHNTPDIHGQFAPGNTISLSGCICRICGANWHDKHFCGLTELHLKKQLEKFLDLDTFQLCFISPLRIKRPEGKKEKGHKYCEEDYFRNHSKAVCRLFESICTHPNDAGEIFQGLLISFVHGMWYDMSYGRTSEETTIGGFLGVIGISGSFPKDLAAQLIISQWTGLGTKKSFGFGQYVIPEIQNLQPLIPLVQNKNLLKASLDPYQLELLLEKMEISTTCGPDGVTVSEFKKMGRQAIHKLTESVYNGSYKSGETRSYKIPKTKGEQREIKIANVSDLLLQKSAAKQLSPVIDRLLSKSSFAYRENYSRHRAFQAYQSAYKSGYHYGIKADIASFFDSVDRFRLLCLLSCLFPNEPLIPYIYKWIQLPETKIGLPQGNPLSPVLSNLYMDQFDRWISEKGFKLIRYSDDFLLLFQTEDKYLSALNFMENRLAQLGLKLESSKVSQVTPTHPITFLGYKILGGEEISDEPEKVDLNETRWLPLFTPGWEKGKIVYITSKIKQTYNQQNNLVLELYEEEQNISVPWQAIDSIVVVGKQRLSGGVISRALEEEIPIFFQFLNGIPYGRLLPEKMVYRMNIMSLQEKRFQDYNYCLAWAKSTITALVHNRRVMLKRYQVTSALTITQIRDRIDSCKSIEELRGVEGNFAKQYFHDFAVLVSPFTFSGRCYHPPDGPVNAMLSLGYTLLYHRLNAALIRRGLDTRTGFFHIGKGTHAALASDLMEELRFLVDRVVLSLIHLKAIQIDDFCSSTDSGPLNRLVDKGFSTYINRFEKTMNTIFQSESSKRSITYNMYLDEIAEKVCGSLKLGLIYEPRIIR